MTNFLSLRREAAREQCLTEQCDDEEKRKVLIVRSIVLEAMADVLSDPENPWILEGRLPPLRLVKTD